ncbi:hypothetical protein [Amycolatopsis sp. NPDC004378]
MSSQHEGMPPWLLATLDQLDAGARDFTVRSRAGFEEMVRGHAHSEREVTEAMTWYDTTKGHFDAGVAAALAGPEAVTTVPPATAVPRPTSYTPSAFDEDDDLVPAPRMRVPEPNFELPDAPDRSTRLLQAPGVYIKGILMGAVMAGGIWFVLTGLLHWWLDSAWWGWWPSLLIVPIAAVVFTVWFTTVHDDVQTWIKKGGPKPLRKRFKV